MKTKCKLLAIAVCILAACETPEPGPVGLESLKIVPSAVQVAPGETFQLSLEYAPAVDGAVFEWTSNNSEVATVDESGLITGISEGEVLIKAVYTPVPKVATCVVSVREKELPPPPKKLFSGGTGTEADPYLISSCEDYLEMAEYMADPDSIRIRCAHYRQNADLDLKQVRSMIQTKSDMPFVGVYDGSSFKISNLAYSIFAYVGSG